MSRAKLTLPLIMFLFVLAMSLIAYGFQEGSATLPEATSKLSSEEPVEPISDHEITITEKFAAEAEEVARLLPPPEQAQMILINDRDDSDMEITLKNDAWRKIAHWRHFRHPCAYAAVLAIGSAYPTAQ